ILLVYTSCRSIHSLSLHDALPILDPIFRREFLNLVQELMLDGNRTIFFSTHITTDLDRIADYIAFIQGGKLVFNQSIYEVAENRSEEHTSELQSRFDLVCRLLLEK